MDIRNIGKGYVGVVVLVKKGNKEFALKIRRIDSQRENMKNDIPMIVCVKKDIIPLITSLG